MKSSRARLANHLVARIGSDPVPHRIIGDILGNNFFEPDVRYLAAAVVLVELDQRSLLNRLIEYLYVILRLPGRGRVTVGPAQLRLSNISHPIPYCACGKTFRSSTSLRHTLGRQHQSLFLLSQISERLVALGSAREAVNAHHKGIDAADLSIETVYSEVVLGLAMRYQTASTTRKERGEINPAQLWRHEVQMFPLHNGDLTRERYDLQE